MDKLTLKVASGCYDLTFSIDKNGDLEIESNEPGSLNGSPTFYLSPGFAVQLRDWLDVALFDRSEWIIKGDYHNVRSVPQGGEEADVECPLCGKMFRVHPANNAECHCKIRWTFDAGSGAIGELPKSMFGSDLSKDKRDQLAIRCKHGVRILERR